MNQKKFENSFDYAFNSEFYSRSKSDLLRGRLKSLSFDLDTSDLSEEELKKLLFKRIWKELRLEELEHSKLRDKIFDFSTEFGSERTSIFVQRSLNSGWDLDLLVDGSIDDKEVDLINSIDNEQVLKGILCHHVASFCEIFAETKNISYLMKWVFR